jgi:hypothetical protein
MRTITLEEHLVSRRFIDLAGIDLGAERGLDLSSSEVTEPRRAAPAPHGRKRNRHAGHQPCAPDVRADPTQPGPGHRDRRQRPGSSRDRCTPRPLRRVRRATNERSPGVRGRRGEECALLDDWASAIHSEEPVATAAGRGRDAPPGGVGGRGLSRDDGIHRHGGAPEEASPRERNPGSRRARFSDETCKLRRVINHPQ